MRRIPFMTISLEAVALGCDGGYSFPIKAAEPYAIEVWSFLSPGA